MLSTEASSSAYVDARIKLPMENRREACRKEEMGGDLISFIVGGRERHEVEGDELRRQRALL